MNQHSYDDIDTAIRKIDLDRRQVFEDRVNRYFNDMRGQEEEDEPLPEDEELVSKALAVKPNLHLDIKQFIIRNKEVVTNGRIVARIFQGISSPRFKAYDWNRCEYWNKYPFIEFEQLRRLSQKVLGDIRSKERAE
jgi:hypothetical protein